MKPTPSCLRSACCSVLATACETLVAGASKAAPKPAPKATKAAVAEAAAALPEEQYSYSAIGKRDPFRSPLDDLIIQGQADSQCPLCKWEIDQLRLVAVVTGTGNPVAMVEDPDGVGHVVRQGTQVGRRNGKVTTIRRDEVVVAELAHDPFGKGDPRTRPSSRSPTILPKYPKLRVCSMSSHAFTGRRPMFDLCTCIASLGALLVALPARASAGVDEVSVIETHADDRGGTVVLRGHPIPRSSASFAWSAPDRIVVEPRGGGRFEGQGPREPPDSGRKLKFLAGAIPERRDARWAGGAERSTGGGL